MSKYISCLKLNKLVSLIRQIDSGLVSIADEREAKKEALAYWIDKLADEQADGILAGLDVDTLNKDKIGLRVSALRKQGIEDMLALSKMSRQQIVNIPGIGEDSAYLIYKMTKAIKQDVKSGLRLRLDPDSVTPAATGLLMCIQDALDNWDMIVGAEQLHHIYNKDIQSALEKVKSFRRPLRRLFMSETNKDIAQLSADYLQALTKGEFFELALGMIDKYSNRPLLSESDCWENFCARSADYYAKIEQLDTKSSYRLASTKHGLPEEIVEEIEVQPLDLTGLKATLRSYQTFGVKYIVKQEKVLLGDEMGLGKTVQAIAAMIALRNEGDTHFMVVCPAGVLINWGREIKKFSDLDVTIIRGGDIIAVRNWVEKGGVAVTTYESVSRFGLPDGFRYGLLIVDEAHYVKNPGTMRTSSVLRMGRSAERVLYMTGTALENKVSEMCFLIKSLRPDIAEELNGIAHISTAPQFREKIAPVYLRRTREDVLTEIPELISKDQWVDLNAAEAEVYGNCVAVGHFMAMRQVSWYGISPKLSSKGKRLVELVELAEEDNRKILVFSYFRETLSTAEVLLGDRCVGTISGSTSPLKRQQLIDIFTQAEPGAVLLCQVLAGGTGVNIQAASVVIFCEPQIKPSMESQAVSRAYRMGQVRNVMVYRLLCDETVDERIIEILDEKQEQFDSFAEDSAAGDVAVESTKQMEKSILALEKERLNLS